METTIESGSIKGRLKGYFFTLDVVISNKVLFETEISILGKGLGYAPTPSFIKEADKKEILKILL